MGWLVCRWHNKIGGIADCEEDCQRMEQDINQLHMGEKWQIKCEVLQFGRSNIKRKSRQHGRTLNSIDVQRVLGVQMQCSLEVATRVDKMVEKMYGILASSGIEYRSQ